MGRRMGCREGLLLGTDRLGRFCLQKDSSVAPRSPPAALPNLPSNQCPYANSRTSTTGVSPNASLNA
jgi:hypothetical protein